VDPLLKKQRSFSAFYIFLTLLLGLALAGCDALPGVDPQATDTSTPTSGPTEPPTATIVWFPPTLTPTPPASQGTPLPTPDERPGVGTLLAQDNFSAKGGWQAGPMLGGTISYGQNQLSLAIPEGETTLVSLRGAALPAAYYLEIGVNVSLCRAKDSYGLLFHSDGAYSAYRWILTCDGQTRVERWRPADIAVVQGWTDFGQAGAPLTQTLGLWVFRDEMRFFINGDFQFAAHDPVLTGALVGVFAHSTGQNPLSVSFSNLVVRQISGYVPTAIPSPTLYVTKVPTHAPTWTPTP
jgi:hypothetical protein